MKVLIIGFGSIGKRHYEVLLELSYIQKICVVTKQDIKNIDTYNSLENVENINEYDYFIIASETNKHFEQLKFLEENVKEKLIFCEKPLFETKKELEVKYNKIFIGYVLRFHPLLKKLKECIQDQKVISVNAKTGQYLPTWRPNTDYKNCYSAKKNEGGGVLLDLSHEVDYVQWLAGQIDEVKSYQVKISDLEIDSDDLTMFLGKTREGVLVNVSIDYISKISHRKLLLETLENTYELNFISNVLTQKNKQGKEENYSIPSLERNDLFKQMHLDILENQNNICTLKEGLEVMDTILKIQEQVS